MSPGSTRGASAPGCPEEGVGIMAEEDGAHQLPVGPLVFGAGGGDVGVGLGDGDRRRGQVVVHQPHASPGPAVATARPRRRRPCASRAW